MFGSAVSLSSDGSAVAIGAPGPSRFPVVSAGEVKIYVWDGTSSAWIQRGDVIEGEGLGDNAGSAVSLSSDGSIVAIGAGSIIDCCCCDSGLAGHVRVYKWSGSAWIKSGNIDVEKPRRPYGAGYVISLSSDGSTLAISAKYEDRGLVQVYAVDSNDWVQRGADITGLASEHIGCSVSLSSDGLALAIGSTQSSSRAGSVRVHEWSGSEWSQRGSDMNGDPGVNRYEMGSYLSLSQDGSLKPWSQRASILGRINVFNRHTNNQRTNNRCAIRCAIRRANRLTNDAGAIHTFWVHCARHIYPIWNLSCRDHSSGFPGSLGWDNQ